MTDSYYARNKEKVKKAAKKWAKNNPEKRKAVIARYHQTHREKERLANEKWRKAHPDRALELLKIWQRKAKKTRPAYVVKVRLRGRLRAALKGIGKKVGSTLEIVGCSWEELRQHIEKQFTDGMSWERIREIEIDHRRPCAAFDLTDPAQQKACFHFTNLQPLWALDNRKKGARVL